MSPILLLSLLAGGAAAEEPAVHSKALFQLWGTAWDQDLDPQADPASYGDPEDDPGFKIRRARIGLEGELPGDVDFELVFGAASPYDVWSEPDTDIGLVDASVGWTLPSAGLRLSAGQQKVPYSREQLVSAGELVFTDRAPSTAHIAPDRETGLVADWSRGGLRLRLGAFNGSGSFTGDDNAGILSAVRAEYSTQPERAYSTWGTVDGLALSVAANAYYNQDLATDVLATGGDLLLRAGGLALLLEGHAVTLTPTETGVAAPDVQATTHRLGGLAQLGYSLGAFEPAVRASYFDDDTAVSDNGDVLELLGGVTAHSEADGARLGLGYVHRQELGGRAMPNDTVRLWVQLRY